MAGPVEVFAEHLAAGIVTELERTREELRLGLAAFNDGMRLRAARPLPVPAVSSIRWGGQCRLVGWSLQAGAGGAATLVLRNGRDASDDPVAVVDLAADASDSQWFGPGGISITEALFVDLVAGSFTGALYLGAVD